MPWPGANGLDASTISTVASLLPKVQWWPKYGAALFTTPPEVLNLSPDIRPRVRELTITLVGLDEWKFHVNW